MKDLSTPSKLKNEIRRRIRQKAKPLWKHAGDEAQFGDLIRAEDANAIVGKLFLEAERKSKGENNGESK